MIEILMCLTCSGKVPFRILPKSVVKPRHCNLSTDPNIVSVNTTGTITAQAQGNAEVIATSNGETKIIHVNVT